MPAKPKSIAAAEKRTIKAEITELRKHRRQLIRSTNGSIAAHKKEIRRMDKLITNIAKNVARETQVTDRRIAILEGRL